MLPDSADSNRIIDPAVVVRSTITELVRICIATTFAGLQNSFTENAKEKLPTPQGLLACSLGVAAVIGDLKSVLAFVKELPWSTDEFIDFIFEVQNELANLQKAVNTTLKVSGVRVQQSSLNSGEFEELADIPTELENALKEYRRRYDNVKCLVRDSGIRLRELLQASAIN